jgi:hypothetical protein
MLSEAKDIVFSPTYEILRSLRSLRMTGREIFARGPFGNRDKPRLPPCSWLRRLQTLIRVLKEVTGGKTQELF